MDKDQGTIGALVRLSLVKPFSFFLKCFHRMRKTLIVPPLIKSSPLDIDLDTGFYHREEYFQVTRHPGCLQQAPCLQAAAPVKILKPSINDSLVVIKICQIAAKSVRLRYMQVLKTTLRKFSMSEALPVIFFLHFGHIGRFKPDLN